MWPWTYASAVLHITALAWIASRRSSRRWATPLASIEHQVLNENLDAQSHKVHRLDAHTVVKNDVSVLLDGCLDVCRKRNCSHIVCAHVIERRNRIGRITTLRDGDVERMLRIGVFKIDEGLGRHNGHLHLQRILQVIAGAIGGMARRTRSNDAQRVKRTGLENINELRHLLTALACGIFGMMLSAYGNALFTQFPTGIMMIMFLGILMNGKYIDERLTIEKQQALLTTTKKDSTL